MPAWLRVPRVLQEGGGDPFLESEACDDPPARGFLERQDASFLAALRGLRPAPGKFLVLGCGTGRLALKLAQAWPGSEVTGVDRSGPALEECLEKARRLGLVGRVWFQEGDACRLDLPERSFDAALSDGLLHHLAEPARMFAGIRRAVRPGGVVLLRDPERPLRPFWAALLGRRRPAAPGPLRDLWAASAAAGYTWEELRALCSGSPLAGASTRRDPDGTLVLERRF
ncbi:MAG: class I SAM-dependent methyltransferase [Elusimicrobia bacterium]|nr:class I SAM-dependent methyltransferase [Elusimicrobiota bacterium]